MATTMVNHLDIRPRQSTPFTMFAHMCRRSLESSHGSVTESVCHSGSRHSMIRVARRSTGGGIFRPRALAVFMLITSSNVAGCSIGRTGRRR
jgi:hypothetical protein